MVGRAARTERIKLTANLLNAVAAGTILTAVIVPFAGMALGTTHLAGDPLNEVAAVLFLFVLAIVVHLVARRFVSQIEDER